MDLLATGMSKNESVDTDDHDLDDVNMENNDINDTTLNVANNMAEIIEISSDEDAVDNCSEPKRKKICQKLSQIGETKKQHVLINEMLPKYKNTSDCENDNVEIIFNDQEGNNSNNEGNKYDESDNSIDDDKYNKDDSDNSINSDKYDKDNSDNSIDGDLYDKDDSDNSSDVIFVGEFVRTRLDNSERFHLSNNGNEDNICEFNKKIENENEDENESVDLQSDITIGSDVIEIQECFPDDDFSEDDVIELLNNDNNECYEQNLDDEKEVITVKNEGNYNTDQHIIEDPIDVKDTEDEGNKTKQDTQETKFEDEENKTKQDIKEMVSILD